MYEVFEQAPRSDKHESIKGTSLHDEGVNVWLVDDWEVFETPFEAGPTRFDNNKDKYYLIVNKTVDSSEELRNKKCDVNCGQYRAGAVRSTLTSSRPFGSVLVPGTGQKHVCLCM